MKYGYFIAWSDSKFNTISHCLLKLSLVELKTLQNGRTATCLPFCYFEKQNKKLTMNGLLKHIHAPDKSLLKHR